MNLLNKPYIFAIMLILTLHPAWAQSWTKETPPAGESDGHVYNVRHWGAQGDGKALDSPAVNSAIKACSLAGGGTVFFPEGTYLCGSIRLRSRVSLHLSKGSTILAAPNKMKVYHPPEPNPFDRWQDFGHNHWHNSLMWGDGLVDISILGPGTIRGDGMTTRNEVPEGGGDKAIALKSCRNITIRDLRIRQGGHFAILATGCDNLRFEGLDFLTNRDGINFDGCTNVLVDNARIASSGDDAIALKSSFALGRKLPCRNILIRNSTLTSMGCNGFQIGSETCGDFENIRVKDCRILGSGKAGIGITTNDGATIDGVTVTNVTMQNISHPVFIHVTDRGRQPGDTPVGCIQNILLENIQASDVRGLKREREGPCIINGKPDSIVRNVTMRNMHITFKGGGTAEDATRVPPYTDDYRPRKLGTIPAWALYCRHAENILLEDVSFKLEKADIRPAVIFSDVEDVTIRDFEAEKSGAKEVIRLERVEGLINQDN